VQPLILPADAEARLVEIAHGDLGQGRADAIDDARQFVGLFPAPGNDAGRAEPPRAEQILHGLGGPVLENKRCVIR
jgi:hypothetical protein